MITAIDGSGGAGDKATRIDLDANSAAALFFVVAQLILNAFLLDLFSGSIIDTYDRLRDESAGSVLLTDSQKMWVKEVLEIMPLRPSAFSRPQRYLLKRNLCDVMWAGWCDFRSSCYTIVTWPAFDVAMTFVVLANMCFIGTSHANQTEFYDKLDSDSNIAFTVIFGLEAAMKITGLGARGYFSSRWMCFEFLIVIVSALTAVLDIGSLGNLIRLIRVMKVLRFAKASPSLERVTRTFLVAVPSFLNVLCFLGLAFFVYAIVGMSLFAGIRRNGIYFLHSDAHFETFGSSFITLVRASTGENWNGIMYALAIDSPFCSEDAPGGSNCGWPLAVPAIYWVSFFLVTNVILINLVTAAIMDAFEASGESDSSETGRYVLTRKDGALFSQVWADVQAKMQPRDYRHSCCSVRQRVSPRGPPSSPTASAGPAGFFAPAPATSSDRFLMHQDHIPLLVARLPSPLGTASVRDLTGLSRSELLKFAWFGPLGGAVDRASADAFESPSPEALRAARIKIKRLPITYDKDRRVPFHALLHVLVENASVTEAVESKPTSSLGALVREIVFSGGVSSHVEGSLTQRQLAALRRLQRRWRKRHEAV